MKKLSTMTAVLATACLATPYVHANSILGIDVSVYQGTLSQANWNSVKADGVSFAFSRAVTGYNYSQDSTFPNNMIRGKAAGLQMGAYQFSHLYANTRRRKLPTSGTTPVAKSSRTARVSIRW